MTNTKFIEYLETTGKMRIHGVYDGYIDDSSNINLKEFYDKFRNKCDIIFLMKMLFEFGYNHPSTKNVQDLKDIMEFTWELFSNKQGLIDYNIMSELDEHCTYNRLDTLSLFPYIDDLGSPIYFNGEMYLITGGETTGVSILNSKLEEVYNNVLAIIKDVKTKEINVISKTDDPEKDSVLTWMEKDKVKILFWFNDECFVHMDKDES